MVLSPLCTALWLLLVAIANPKLLSLLRWSSSQSLVAICMAVFFSWLLLLWPPVIALVAVGLAAFRTAFITVGTAILGRNFLLPVLPPSLPISGLAWLLYRPCCCLLLRPLLFAVTAFVLSVVGQSLSPSWLCGGSLSMITASFFMYICPHFIVCYSL
jgi:hypothetical protein